MSYEKYYPGGWQSGESGGTPITPEALNHIENGIKQTYSDFAPAGYGLGDINGMFCTDANTATKIGFYWLGGEGTLNVPFYFSWGTLLVERRQTHIYQTAKSADGYPSQQIVTRYSTNSGATWSEWEWVNPPMVPGVEYRTTERYQGKAVYVAVVDIGTLPNKTLKSVEHNIFCTNIIRFSGAKSDGTGLSYDDGTAYVRLSATLYYIKVFTNIDLSDQTGMATIYYVK